MTLYILPPVADPQTKARRSANGAREHPTARCDMQPVGRYDLELSLRDGHGLNLSLWLHDRHGLESSLGFLHRQLKRLYHEVSKRFTDLHVAPLGSPQDLHGWKTHVPRMPGSRLTGKETVANQAPAHILANQLEYFTNQVCSDEPCTLTSASHAKPPSLNIVPAVSSNPVAWRRLLQATSSHS